MELWSGAGSMQSLLQVFVAEGYFFLQSVVFILRCATSDSCCVIESLFGQTQRLMLAIVQDHTCPFYVNMSYLLSKTLLLKIQSYRAIPFWQHTWQFVS